MPAGGNACRIPMNAMHADSGRGNTAIGETRRILALRGAKHIAHARRAPGLREAREMSDALRAQLEWSDDVDEAIAAHREGRKPRFTGK